MKIGILQPLYPHYRESFFKKLSTLYNINLFSYHKSEILKKSGFNHSDLEEQYLSNIMIANKIRIYNFLPLLKREYDVIVLPGEINSLSTWILLIIHKFSPVKIILLGHGISIRNYLKEEKKLSTIRVLFHKLSDHIWLYTENEKMIWSKYIDKNKITALNNTIDTEKILNLPLLNKEAVKKKYDISTTLNLIFCARFTPDRRIDLMIEAIKKTEKKNIGFIIIGDGQDKPDFSNYSNVYDFGAVYNEKMKHELFTIADLYFQPAWTGLSIVEAMAYGKPILTFKRSLKVLQCVEYSYIHDNINGKIFSDLDTFIDYISKINVHDITKLSQTTQDYVKKYLSVEFMVNNVQKSLKELS